MWLFHRFFFTASNKRYDTYILFSFEIRTYTQASYEINYTNPRQKNIFKKANKSEMTWVCLLIVQCKMVYLNLLKKMIGSTWYFLYLTFHTAVVPVRAVCQAPLPCRLSTTRTVVKLFAFVQLPFAPGVAGGRQDEVICKFSNLPKNSKKWNYNDCQGKFHHFQSSWSLLSFSFCKIEKKLTTGNSLTP